MLTGAIVSDGAPGETRLTLTFDQVLPQFSIVSNDSDRDAIVFAGTIRAQGAAVAGPHGLLRGVEFSQTDGTLSLTILGQGAVRIDPNPATAHTLVIAITRPPRAGRSESAVPPPVVPRSFSRRDGGGFEVVRLKYADVSEIVGLLSTSGSVKPNDYFSPQEPAFGSQSMNQNAYGSSGIAPNMIMPGAAQGGPEQEDALGQSVDESIGIDRRLNAIILRGTPAHIAALKAEIEQLDLPVTSVVLETLFVELTTSGARNVGIDFANSNNQVAVLEYTTGGFSPAGDFKGVGSASVQAAIYAEVQKGEGKIISKPRISAQSGSLAKIVTGDALPILTSIQLSGVNGVQQQVQYVNVGVTLQIGPRVTDDGYVTSHIFAEVSNVTGFSQGYPTISQREASTSATVKDGETFVIGGLTQKSELATDTHIPILGDIPLLGKLFQVHRGTDSKTDLYIVVTPHIVRPMQGPPTGPAGTPH
jgi:general secretion pathway protein D